MSCQRLAGTPFGPGTSQDCTREEDTRQAAGFCLSRAGRAQGWGGLHNRTGSTSVFTNAVLGGPTVTGGGGGAYNGDGSSVTLTNASLSRYHAGGSGGPLHNYGDGSATRANSILWGDASDSGMNEIHADAGSSQTATCSIAGAG